MSVGKNEVGLVNHENLDVLERERTERGRVEFQELQGVGKKLERK